MNKDFDVELFKRLFGAEVKAVEVEELFPLLEIKEDQPVQLKSLVTGWVTTAGVRHRFVFKGKLEGVSLFQQHIDVGYELSRVLELSEEQLREYEFKVIK